MLKSFLLGAIAGGTAVWLWRGEIERLVDERTRGIRTKAADGIQSVEKTAESVVETLHASQEAIRPSGGRSAA
jgi:hypothetical protein